MSDQATEYGLGRARAALEYIQRKAGTFATPGPVIQPFGQPADLVTAMQDPRYKTDAEYRKSVAARVAAMRGVSL